MLTRWPLDREFLVELLTAAILTIFFFFYFNRLFATLVSYGIRAYTWHQYRAYIDIQALQFSLLGGRIFFKDIRYHGHNETILVHGGHITWRYWLRKTKEAEIFSDDATKRPSTTRTRSTSATSFSSLNREEKGGVKNDKSRSQPCRILVKVSGVEAFLYNRSPAYDSVKEAMSRFAGVDLEDGHTLTKDKSPPTQNVLHKRREAANAADTSSSDSRPSSASIANPTSATTTSTEPPSFLQILPIGLECNKGAIVLGNENTTSVITAKFDSATGEIDAGQAGHLDYYKQIFRFKVKHPVIQMRPNPDFKSLQLDAADRLKHAQADTSKEESPKKRNRKSSNRARGALHALRNLAPIFRSSMESLTIYPSGTKKPGRRDSQIRVPGQERWQGLSRYIEENDDEHQEWDAVEYAKSSTIVDCPQVDVSYFWDIPGTIPSGFDYEEKSVSPGRDINGTSPPDYGLEVEIHGGTVTYGPWADRQRTNFQSYFFPMNYTDAIPAKTLQAGDTRVATKFKLYLSIAKETIVRLPMREPSKDWKWKGKAGTVTGDKSADKGKDRVKNKKKPAKGKKKDNVTNPNVRPFGWIDLKIFEDSTVSYCMDMVASPSGYSNSLEVDVKKLEIFSSVNHGLLWRSKGLSLEADLSNPCRWNQLREWRFDLVNRDLELFLLRDHLFLLTDLISDWGSGPPPDFYTFTPYRYLLNVEFRDFKLFLNCNDGNIINSPADLDDNEFIILGGKTLDGHVTIPLENFRPISNEIFFDVKGIDMGLELAMPPKNTLHTFIKDQKVAYLGELGLGGSHTYFSETSPSNTDILHFDIHGSKFVLALYGFLIRHFMKIKENYFGEHLHFKTLEEFQEVPRTADSDNPQPAIDLHKKTNDLDVILNIVAEDASVLLPANLYSVSDNVRIEVPFVHADLRFTNYYMELMCDFSPLSLSQSTQSSELEGPLDSSNPAELRIDAVRIYGHRLFGLPPTEPTYVCNWDFDVGNVTGDCSVSFLDKAARGGKAFGFTLDDDENAMPIPDLPIIHDITFLRLRTGAIRVWIRIDSDAILLSTDTLSLDFNDWADQNFSRRLNFLIPSLTVACADVSTVSRRHSRINDRIAVPVHAFLQTTVKMNMLARKYQFTSEREKQQDHVREHDQRTRRTDFLLLANRAEVDAHRSRSTHINPPAMPFPPMPSPMFTTEWSQSSPWSASNEGAIASSSGSTSRSYSSNTGSGGNGRHPPLSRSTSTSSFADSIRNSPARLLQSARPTLASHQSTQSPPSYFHGDHLSTRKQRGGFSSSVAFSSPLMPLRSSLDFVDFELDDVPRVSNEANNMHSDDEIVEDQTLLYTSGLDEELAHTSFIISTGPGISVFCKPKAIHTALSLIDGLSPKRPEDLLDAYHIDVMSRILGIQKKAEGTGQSIELSVKVPHIHLRLINPMPSPMGGPNNGADQFDVVLDHLAVAFRSKSKPTISLEDNATTLHTTISSFNIAVAEKPSETMRAESPAAEVRIIDAALWLFSSEKTTVNLAFRDFEVASLSKKIEYQAGLTDRTAALVGDIDQRVQSMDQQQSMRLRSLIYQLTFTGKPIPDPIFLTRPSYALRANRDHLRTQDSWKIISRLRFILDSAQEEVAHYHEVCKGGRISPCPEDAEQQVIKFWDQWRTWDIAHVKKSFAMRAVWGGVGDMAKTTPPKPKPIHVEVTAGLIRLIIDPRSSRNEFRMKDMITCLDSTPPAAAAGLMVMMERPTRETTLQVHMGVIELRLDWQVCGIVDSLLRTILHSDAIHEFKDTNEPRLKDAMSKETAEIHSFQVVFATDAGSINLDTPTMQASMVARSLKLSLLGTDKMSFQDGLSGSALLQANSAFTEIRSRSRSLCLARAESPSLFISYDKDGNSGNPDQWHFAGSTTAVLLDIREEIHGLIEVTDALLQKEVAEVKYMIKEFPRRPNRSKKTPASSSPLPLITLALLMDSYAVEISLLQSLSYSISGHTGRISSSPDLHHKLAVDTNFDLDSHTHRLRGQSHHGSDVIAEFTIPPVNGSVKMFHSRPSTHMDISTTMEKITFDASALHGIFTTVNKSEISTALDAIKADLSVVKTHAKDLFTSPDPQSPEEPTQDGPPLTYNVHLTLAGLSVTAAAPGATPKSPIANLVFETHCVLFRATNTSEDRKIIYPITIFNVGIQHVGVELSLSHKGRIRRCGNIALGFTIRCSLEDNATRRELRLDSHGLEVNMYADTASAVVDVLNHLQDRLKDLDLSRENKYLRRLRHTRRRTTTSSSGRFIKIEEDIDTQPNILIHSSFAVEILNIQVCWIVGNSVPTPAHHEKADLVLSFKRIALSAKKQNVARLSIEDMQLQMVPVSQSKRVRSMNSALLPEVVFNVAYASTKGDRKFAMQAAGKSLDIRLEPTFVVPASMLQQSIALAAKKVRLATATWQQTPTASGAQRKSPFGNKKVSSLLVDADFAGAVVTLLASQGGDNMTVSSPTSKAPQTGRFGQFSSSGPTAGTSLRAPGVALKVQYTGETQNPTLNIEFKVNASTNTLYPSVVPLIMEISDSVKEVVREPEEQEPEEMTASKMSTSQRFFTDEENNLINDPSAILGKTKLNFGLRICKQEFSLSCQPIARVAATAKFEDIYMTVNSVESSEYGHFFAASATFDKFEASVQHVYSRESTFRFVLDKVVISLMNSKHVSGTSGMSAILKVFPARTHINGKQLQDFLLFREIWVPQEVRQASNATTESPSESQEYLVQRYQEVSAAAAFPWNATVMFEDLSVEFDLGQAIGKPTIRVVNLWATSKKNSDWEQQLCIGVEKVGITSTGRTSGFVELDEFKVRTWIAWPQREQQHARKTPLVQASVSFDRLKVKAAFDYQPFAIADITDFAFIMYNVREAQITRDRLVAILDGGKVQIFCISTTASQALALLQAVERLAKDNQEAFKQSLKDIERYLLRRSSKSPSATPSSSQLLSIPENHADKSDSEDSNSLMPISLHTDVNVTLRAVHFGVFPSSFTDSQILIVAAADAQARFGVTLDKESKIHSSLGLTLGQLSVALAHAASVAPSTNTAEPTSPRPDSADIDTGESSEKRITRQSSLTSATDTHSIESVVASALNARGGTILRVPKVVATMQTWQTAASNRIDYIFKSSFEGKVDVGWNYNRIAFIRSMWATHSRTLASRLGRQLPSMESGIRITAADTNNSGDANANTSPDDKATEGKITAVVNVPQSRYEYVPLEPPIIVTPQLRDMGEATPPLEWIGLHRDRLPNVTHQIVIVTLLEVAREVEDAYSRILGSS
jgi:hypothetical protein